MFRFTDLQYFTIVAEKKNKQFDKKGSRSLIIILMIFFFSNRYLSTLKMMPTVQLALLTLLQFACFCSAYAVTGPETPLEQRDSNNEEVRRTLRLRLLGNLADSRIDVIIHVTSMPRSYWCLLLVSLGQNGKLFP